MKTKWSRSVLIFGILWLATGFIHAFICLNALEYHFNDVFAGYDNPYIYPFFCISTLVVFLIRHQLIKHILGLELKNWLLSTSIGTALGIFLGYCFTFALFIVTLLLWTNYFVYGYHYVLQTLMEFTMYLFFRYFLLWRQVSAVRKLDPIWFMLNAVAPLVMWPVFGYHYQYRQAMPMTSLPVLPFLTLICSEILTALSYINVRVNEKSLC